MLLRDATGQVKRPLYPVERQEVIRRVLTLRIGCSSRSRLPNSLQPIGITPAARRSRQLDLGEARDPGSMIRAAAAPVGRRLARVAEVVLNVSRSRRPSMATYRLCLRGAAGSPKFAATGPSRKC